MERVALYLTLVTVRPAAVRFQSCLSCRARCRARCRTAALASTAPLSSRGARSTLPPPLPPRALPPAAHASSCAAAAAAAAAAVACTSHDGARRCGRGAAHATVLGSTKYVCRKRGASAAWCASPLLPFPCTTMRPAASAPSLAAPARALASARPHVQREGATRGARCFARHVRHAACKRLAQRSSSCASPRTAALRWRCALNRTQAAHGGTASLAAAAAAAAAAGAAGAAAAAAAAELGCEVPCGKPWRWLVVGFCCWPLSC